MRPVDPRLLREVPAVRRYLVGATLAGAVLSVAVVAQAVLLADAIAGVFVEGDDLADVTPLLVGVAVATLVRAGLLWALESAGRLTSLRVASTLRARLLGHLLEARPAGVPEQPSGAIATTAVQGLDALEPYFSRFLPQLVLSVVTPVAILLWVFPHDALSGFVMLFTLPLIPLFGALVGKTTGDRTAARLQMLSMLSAHFLDVVRGLATLRAYGRSRTQVAVIGDVSDAYRRETMGTLRLAFLSALVLELAATLSTAVIAVEIGVRLVDSRIAFAPALAVLILAPELYGPLRAAAAQFHASAEGVEAAQRVFRLLDLPESVPPAPEQPVELGTVGEVALDAVTFSYPESAPALSGVSLTARAGSVVAVVGPSGSGKTTLLLLLMRLLAPTGGAVRAGGVDLLEVAPDAWRRRVAWMPQRPRLGDGTLRDVVLAGADADDAALRGALAAASALDLVEAFPGGLDAPVDETPTLSLGEVRRLALARALVRAADVVLLDEPTASLDPESAAAVVEAIGRIPRDRIVVVATHDDRVVARADVVVELREGQVVGTREAVAA